jgi:hypothetical protein
MARFKLAGLRSIPDTYGLDLPPFGKISKKKGRGIAVPSSKNLHNSKNLSGSSRVPALFRAGVDEAMVSFQNYFSARKPVSSAAGA